MTKKALILVSVAVLLGACSATGVPEASADESENPVAASEAGLTKIPASPTTQTKFGITRWESRSLESTVSVVGLNDSGTKLFAFEFASAEENQVRIAGKASLSAREVGITEAFFADDVRNYELTRADNLVEKTDTGCTACDQGEDNWCAGNVMLCSQTKFCPVDGPPFQARKRCGTPHQCGACVSGMFW